MAPVERREINETRGEQRVRDQSYIKQCNIQTVLAVLKHHQPISRTDIARVTGMSPTSITRIVTALMTQGLIYEASGEMRSGRGRKATSLCVNEEGLYSIGIHLEKSVIRLCVINCADRVLYRGETLVDGECTPERMAQEAKALYERMPEGIVPDRSLIGAVGVCLSGAVDKWKGKVARSCQLGWQNVDLEGLFGEAFGITACVENDVKACLIGEKVRMGIPDETDTVYLLIGSSIGLAATSGGLLARGRNNEAGAIAGLPVGRKPDGSPDYLVNHLWEGRMLERAREYEPSAHSLESILMAQRQGKSWADELIADFRLYLESAVRTADCVFNPERIIIGGTVTHRLYPDIAERMGMDILSLGTHYEESCMTGAGLIAMRRAIIERIGQAIE